VTEPAFLFSQTISIVIKERLSSGAIEKAKVKQAKATSQGSKVGQQLKKMKLNNVQYAK